MEAGIERKSGVVLLEKLGARWASHLRKINLYYTEKRGAHPSPHQLANGKQIHTQIPSPLKVEFCF